MALTTIDTCACIAAADGGDLRREEFTVMC